MTRRPLESRGVSGVTVIPGMAAFTHRENSEVSVGWPPAVSLVAVAEIISPAVTLAFVKT